MGASEEPSAPPSPDVQRTKMLKPCRICKTPYQPTPSQLKKWAYTCKPCRRKEDAIWRDKRRAAGFRVPSNTSWAPEKREAWKKRYYSDPAVLAKKAARMRRYSKDPALRQKHEARWAVSRAIVCGKLVRQPCPCGETKSQAHHHDYGKPLDVKWLCRPCHTKEHKAAKCGEGK